MHHMILDSMKDKPILNTAGKYDYTYSSHKNDKFWFSVVTNDNNTLNGHIKNITFKTIPEDAVKREYPNSITFDGPYKTSKEATAALQKTAHTMKNNPLFGEVTIAVKTNLPKKARSL
jgi:hypothetical protein